MRERHSVLPLLLTLTATTDKANHTYCCHCMLLLTSVYALHCCCDMTHSNARQSLLIACTYLEGPHGALTPLSVFTMLALLLFTSLLVLLLLLRPLLSVLPSSSSAQYMMNA
jgi:hypothetical protein